MIPKFRAWEESAEEGLQMWSWKEMCEIGLGQLFNNPKYELMQSTGLKDKNGVEIYEGDIVRRRDFVCDEVYFNVGQISYSGVGVFAGQFIFKSQSGNIDGMYSRYGDEVIGNIYENPELLEVTE